VYAVVPALSWASVQSEVVEACVQYLHQIVNDSINNIPSKDQLVKALIEIGSKVLQQLICVSLCNVFVRFVERYLTLVLSFLSLFSNRCLVMCMLSITFVIYFTNWMLRLMIDFESLYLPFFNFITLIIL
jgi:hypothetical protein